jgi:RNA polymerase sigma-70 factor (ECF subfamily)
MRRSICPCSRTIVTSCGRSTRRAATASPAGSACSRSDAHELACDLPDPFESAVEAERAGIAANLLASFSAKDRTFATLYFGEELDPSEIASRLNISVKTVYSKKHKIQSRLESVLAGDNARGAIGRDDGSDDEAAA